MSAEPPSLLVGTAGHIDHGKSALVRALTGIDPDRLEEEKERGITIDLGFAHMELEGGRVGFVDVPGHERFVKNMLAGIGGIDAVLLVVAADESLMPQTREHLQICRLLGIPDGVIALTKCDRVDDELVEIVELEVRELVAGSFLEDAAVVRTSATRGDGLGELETALDALRRRRRARDLEGPARLPVDRVFTVHGFGTVVTGTLMSGRVQPGDTLELLPAGEAVGVRGIQVHGNDVELARAGERTALNVPDLDVEEAGRGHVLATPEALGSTRLVDARLRVLPDFDPIEPLQRVRFHQGAAEIMARLDLLDADRIEPGGSGLVQIRLEAPSAVLPGDRFIVRRYSPMTTIGGGTVLDPLPDRHRGRRAARVAFLRRLEGTGLDGRLRLFVERADTRGMTADQLRRRLGLTRQKLARLAAQATAGGALVAASEQPLHLVHRHAIEPLQERILARLDRYHEDEPLRPAMPKEALRAAAAADVPDVVFTAALRTLHEAGRIRPVADGFATTDHRVRLDGEQRRLEEQLIELFERSGLSPPSADEVAGALPGDPEPTRVEPLLHHLLREKRLVRVKEDMLIDAARIRDLVEELRRRHAPGDRFSVADFKNWTETTRKHAIPLLEYLDRERVTRRVGDERELLEA